MIPYKKERDERELKSSSLKNIPYFCTVINRNNNYVNSHLSFSYIRSGA